MKIYKLLTLIFLSILFLQSCERLLTGRSNKNKVHGTVTDKETGEAIKEVKLSIYIDDFDRTNGEDEITEHNAYTDNSGYYDIKFKREDGTHYYIKPTHEDYVYGFKNGWYPNLENGLENEINFEMEEIGIVKIEGTVIGPFYLLEDAKISVLKRENGNTNYPEATGTEVFSNITGEYYIEFNFEQKTPVKIDIYDFKGRNIYTKMTNNRIFFVNLADQISGIYLLKMTVNNKIYSKKIIIQK